jgi:hypothetical protein
VENEGQKYLSQIGHFPVPDDCTDNKDAFKQYKVYFSYCLATNSINSNTP